MDTLRLVLILLGIIIIAAIYLYARKSSGLPLFGSRSDDTDVDELIPDPPTLTDDDIAGAIRDKRYASDVPHPDAIDQLSESISAGVNPEINTHEVESLSSLSNEEGAEPLIVVFNIMAKQGKMLAGLDILDATLAAGFKHGEMNIFHYHDDALTDKRELCSLANSIEPGFFEMETIEEVSTPGLTLFMQLPGPVDGRIAFEETLKLGRVLAENLGADLCDDTRSVLTMQSIEHIKEKIEAYRFKTRMAQIKQHRH